ncbi:hypothetical protein RRG08_046168 [Elysia crispata]|uniref:Uncharacterized protein n=1 Tax=Elysia crispata TaxID=231223 RepID=A0AAE0XNH8_9GAST|nr:hypothetical protein RRG08_046168 [Elysia crispata]
MGPRRSPLRHRELNTEGTMLEVTGRKTAALLEQLRFVASPQGESRKGEEVIRWRNGTNWSNTTSPLSGLCLHESSRCLSMTLTADGGDSAMINGKDNKWRHSTSG